jgi:rare lipoprotein A
MSLPRHLGGKGLGLKHLYLIGCGLLGPVLLDPAYANASRPGAYYLDDGPMNFSAADLERVPDATPQDEPLHRFANNPYSVFGIHYVPKKSLGEFSQRGIASWYGRRFHGQRTSSGEPYNMFAMTAAHPTLPIPSYARVTNVANGRSVVVRINDRGPFHAGRVIDLSFTAAWKLGYANRGSAAVEITRLIPNSPSPADHPGNLVLASAASGMGAGATSATASEPDPIEQLVLSEAEKTMVPSSRMDIPQATEVRGVFLQVAAFSNRDNAESFRAHLERELGDQADKLVIHATDGLFRVRLGPYANDAHARRAAGRLRTTFDVKAVVVQ